MVDIVILLILLISLLVGFFRGFVKEALSLATWIVSIWLGFRFYTYAGSFFDDFLKQELIRNIAGFAAVFISSMIVLSMISYLFSKVVSKTGIKGTDRVLGFLFGIIRGILIVVLGLLMGRSLNANELQIWQDSKLIPFFDPVVSTVNDLLPDGLRVEGVDSYKGAEIQEIPSELQKQSSTENTETKKP